MLIAKFGRHWRRWQLRRCGAQIGNDLQSFGPFFTGEAAGFRCGGQALLEAGARVVIGRTDAGPGRLIVGSHLYMNHYAIVNAHLEIVIGDHVMIGPHAYICDFDHYFRSEGRVEIGSGYTGLPVYIGNHAWIGANAVVLKGVNIGSGAVVGAGAVVTHDIPPMAVAVGNPATVKIFRGTKLD